MLNKTWIARWAVAAGCATLMTLPALADEVSPRVEVQRLVIRRDGPRLTLTAQEQPDESQRGERRREAIKLSDHWLGLECFPLDAALRSHLGLAEGEGLIIEQVVPDSPAAKAELKRYDVIVRAGAAAVKSLPDLMKAVDEAKENELALEIVRGGKLMTVKVVPAKRPERQDVLRRIPNQAREDLRGWMERFSQGHEEPFRYRFFGPGAVLPGSEHGLPKGLSVTITRAGGEPAKITVKKGEETWEISEKELDKLPIDVRPHVERMLGRGMLALPAPPGVPAPPAIVAPPAARRFEGSPDRQLKQMMDQLETLRKQMEELQRNLPQETKPPTNESRA
jgi:hypothetical protein